MKKRNMKVFSLLLAASMTVPQLADYSQLSGLTVVHAAVNDQVSEKAVTEKNGENGTLIDKGGNFSISVLGSLVLDLKD